MSKETLRRQIREMLELQDKMNTRVHAEWRKQNNPWFRAIWTECAEMMDHHGWKWWKKQVPDMEQVKLEVVDIWHFGLSYFLQYTHPLSSDDIEDLVEHMTAEWKAVTIPSTSLEVLPAVEELAASALAEGEFNIHIFFEIMRACGMTMDDLYKGYVGKNVLNLFRQDHGYSEGTYKKEWNGLEDNEQLSDILLKVEVNEGFQEELYNRLLQRYEGVV